MTLLGENAVLSILAESFSKDTYHRWFIIPGVNFKHASDAVRFKLMCG